jgi:predicted adenylyl cyclase CyaB
LRRANGDTAQPAKTTLFAGGSGADVRKSAAGDFFPLTRGQPLARNIEIKAHIASVAALIGRTAEIADEGPTEISQDDTFFECRSGRLKLRTFANGEGELIFYRRTDEHGPKESYYVRTPTAAPDSLREILTLAYGQAGRVRKRRTLFLAGRTRIHLDVVENLGHFLELEVVLRESESTEAGVREAEELMKRLGVEPSQLVDRAYVDLLAERDQGTPIGTSTPAGE